MDVPARPWPTRRLLRRALPTTALVLSLTACGSTVATSGTAFGPGTPQAPGTTSDGLAGPGSDGAQPGVPLSPGTVDSQPDTPGSPQIGGPSSAARGVTVPGTPRPGGAARSTKPISVGFLAADYTALVKAVGGSTSGSDPHTVSRALVKALNVRGGFAGRKIEPVYATVDGTATDYSAQEQAACEAFTRDNKVELVLAGGVGGETFYACLLKAGVPMITGNPTEGTDRATLARYPNVFNPPGMATDRQAIALLEQSIRTGWLRKGNKVGVLVSGCPWGTRAYDGIVVPRLKALGVAVESFSIGCPPPGSGQIPATSSATQNAVLQFRGSGVDRVMILAGHGDATSYVLFTSNAESQGWRPGYIVGSNAVAQAWVSQGVVSREQGANTQGAGWVPVVDSSTPDYTPQARACDALAVSGGAPAPPIKGQYGLFCDAFLVARDALERAGGVGGLTALRPALESLGSSHVGAGSLRGGILLDRDRHDGARFVAPFGYLQDCGCFRYLASPQPAP